MPTATAVELKPCPLYINGQPVISRGPKDIQRNPATGEVVAEIPRCTPEEISAAVEAAHRAFPSWSKTPVLQRCRVLFKYRQVLEEHAGELIALMTEENGKTLEEARKTGRVRTLFGRVRPIPDILTRDYNARNFAERTALNSPIQGTAADIIKLAMIRIYRAFKNRGFSAKITIQVHDELVLEVPEAESEEVQNLVRHEMENAGALDVPLVVDLTAGKNWKDMK